MSSPWQILRTVALAILDGFAQVTAPGCRLHPRPMPAVVRVRNTNFRPPPRGHG